MVCVAFCVFSFATDQRRSTLPVGVGPHYTAAVPFASTSQALTPYRWHTSCSSMCAKPKLCRGTRSKQAPGALALFLIVPHFFRSNMIGER